MTDNEANVSHKEGPPKTHDDHLGHSLPIRIKLRVSSDEVLELADCADEATRAGRLERAYRPLLHS